MNFYGVNRETGKLITLAKDLLMGEGKDIPLKSGTQLDVKVFIHTHLLSRLKKILMWGGGVVAITNCSHIYLKH